MQGEQNTNKMKFKFNGTTEEEKEKIKRIVNLVKTSSAKDLLVRISMHRPHTRTLLDGTSYKFYRTTRKHGYYKNLYDHGMYNSEWKEIYEKKNCPHIIQLHLCDNESDKSIAEVFAHEWRHYLQFTKLRNRFGIDCERRKKRIELDARRWAAKRILKTGFTTPEI